MGQTLKYSSVVVRGVQEHLTYEIPSNCVCHPGHEVLIEIRNRTERGWVIEVSDTPFIPLKKEKDPSSRFQSSLFQENEIPQKVKVKKILASHPAFNPIDIPFFQWISDYYGAPLYEVLENAVPKVHQLALEKAVCIHPDHQDSITDTISSIKKKAPRQAELLLLLLEHSGIIPKSALSDQGLVSAYRALEKKGILLTQEIEKELPGNTQQTAGPPLNKDQKNAVETIKMLSHHKKFSPVLLFGITGSGKTEVYMESIRSVISSGGNALLIVPEIALTPQILQRFRDRLGIPIAVLHSKVGSSSRWESWNMILNNTVSLTIGARSAIFAPIHNLSLIIVDEEHESSFKQSDGLRYHARDLAIMRAKLHSCPVILGSATPSFETLQNTAKGTFSLLELKERATRAQLPEISVIDMRDIKRSDMASENISPRLFDEIKSTLEKGEQVILFYNRRGFSSFLQCRSCGYVLSCTHCSVTMTYYKNKERVSCHYCGEHAPAPTLCPRCHDLNVIEINEDMSERGKKQFGLFEGRGSGTEKIYDEVSTLFPGISIARMDRESVTGKDSMETILQSMHDGSSQILIGTQMIAKGHDLPNVTLVGFINADIGLHFPDFRASERIFQLIVQAAGRAGRGILPGKVLLQTFEPDHPTIVAAVQNKFKAFARYELEFRKQLEYPPFARLARIVSSSTDREVSQTAAHRVSTYLKSMQAQTANELSPWKILGPSTAPIEKLRGRYRWHLLLKSTSANTLSRIATHLNHWKHTQKDLTDFRLTVDIDPVDML
jgi:primosomal protein N' (replication factor Y) (superfamily II helicase)